jgi:hypothetical protein
MKTLVEQIQGLKQIVPNSEPINNRIDIIAGQAQRLQDELHDLHNWIDIDNLEIEVIDEAETIDTGERWTYEFSEDGKKVLSATHYCKLFPTGLSASSRLLEDDRSGEALFHLECPCGDVLLLQQRKEGVAYVEYRKGDKSLAF